MIYERVLFTHTVATESKIDPIVVATLSTLFNFSSVLHAVRITHAIKADTIGYLRFGPIENKYYVL